MGGMRRVSGPGCRGSPAGVALGAGTGHWRREVRGLLGEGRGLGPELGVGPGPGPLPRGRPGDGARLSAGRAFPSSFEAQVRRICRLLFHVLAHIYSCHFKETLALELHGHLNTLYVHFLLFAREFSLLDPKETAVMDDLTEALCSGAGGAGGSGAGAGGAVGAQNHVKER